MSKYLNVFNTLAEYQAFSASTEYVQPNVALVKETNVLYYDYGDNKPQADMSDYKVESQETSVGGDNYGNSAITKINYIPNGITSLIDAFKFFYSLEEVTCKIPDSVIHMKSTFYGCRSLVNAPDIPSGVINMESTFYECRSLVNAPNISSGVTNMNSTFANCISLVTAPDIPNSVTNMGSTFYGCRSLVTAPNIPSGVTNMNFTFYGCTNLVNAPVIPSSVTSIFYTFKNCTSLKEVTFLHTTPITYSNTLQGCSKLENIYVPDESVDAYKTATGWSEFASKFKPLSSKPTK